jgi:methionyl-tRNA formyltransferase
MRMEAGLDTGPVYLCRELPLAPDETGGSLHDRLAALGAEALMEALPGIADGSGVPKPQDPDGATYAHKLDKAEARIDWGRPALAIERQVRAFDPWPVAQTTLNGETLRIWLARAQEGGAGVAPGVVVASGRSGILVATGSGLLRITRLQAPGKRPMDAIDFLNARRLDGSRFV